MDGRDFLGRPGPTSGCRVIYDDDLINMGGSPGDVSEEPVM